MKPSVARGAGEPEPAPPIHPASEAASIRRILGALPQVLWAIDCDGNFVLS
jgi:hypothetical protein